MAINDYRERLKVDSVPVNALNDLRAIDVRRYKLYGRASMQLRNCNRDQQSRKVNFKITEIHYITSLIELANS